MKAWILVCALLGGWSQFTLGDETYEITITSRASSALTSIVWATHGKRASMYRRGRKASPGLAELAKDGVTSILKREMKAQEGEPRGVHSVGEAFGVGKKGTVTFRVRADSRRARLSWATMAVCSNDTFAGQAGMPLPRQGAKARKRRVVALDAGAEVNTEAADDVPCLGAHGVGPAENGVIRRSDAIRGDADLSRSRGWGRYIATIKVRRIR